VSGRRRRRRNRRKFPWVVIAALLGISVYQFQSEGTVSWPAQLLDRVRDYVASPSAGWRKAAQGVEQLGAIREGQSPGRFDLQGRVVGITDGDSLVLLDERDERHEVRLFGIDTPEWDQPHGKSAKRALASLVSRQQVGLVVVNTDGFGRTVATVYLGERNINLAMVEAGHAWWFRRYAPYERHLEQAEQEARQAKRGLWGDPEPIPPWSWRRR
jgi:endonuclease YncB( thermonuclease family)